MKRMKLFKYEKEIERAIARGEYVPVPKEEHEEYARAIARWRKNAILSMRINQGVLDALKRKAKKLGVPYQTFIAEILRRQAA